MRLVREDMALMLNRHHQGIENLPWLIYFLFVFVACTD